MFHDDRVLVTETRSIGYKVDDTRDINDEEVNGALATCGDVNPLDQF